MALLIDTNVVLDWILKRSGFHENATKIVGFCMSGKMRGYLAAHTVLNVFYITRKDFSLEERRDLSRLLCNRFEIIGVNRQIMLDALAVSDFRDLEDEVQSQCAADENLDYIITRDIGGFVNSKVRPISPNDFLAAINS
jgi:predicted nucleic acid-binding protein